MLTDLQVRSAKAMEKDYKLSDGRGLHLLVRSNGAKLWQVRYWIGNKERKFSLGPYPEVTLQEARESREELRRLVAKGLDPQDQKRAAEAQKRDSESFRFEAVARGWFETWSAGKSERHASYVIRRLEADAFPALGQKLISEIRPPEIVAMVREIAGRGARDIAKRVFQTTSQIFRFSVANGFCDSNPCAHIRPSDVLPVSRKRHFARIDAKELPDLLRKIEAYRGEPSTRIAIQLLARTFVRTAELIGARWAEFDLVAAEWRIPAERMKMKRIHVVPLSWQCVELLQVMKTISGHRELVFPGLWRLTAWAIRAV